MPSNRSPRYTLVSEGPSDRSLIFIIDWLLLQHSPEVFQSQWGDLGQLRKRPRNLNEKIACALDLYPADLIFVHRDADDGPREDRVSEIRAALPASPPAVCVIPVRTTESWFLIDEIAIRRAAGNPNGKVPLRLPKPSEIENKPDPKGMVHELLKVSSELPNHRLHQFRAPASFLRLAESIEDFSALRQLSAFAAFEADLKAILAENEWGLPPLARPK